LANFAFRAFFTDKLIPVYYFITYQLELKSEPMTQQLRKLAFSTSKLFMAAGFVMLMGFAQACSQDHQTSSLDLIGGQKAARGEFDSVFIWSSQKDALESYCTASKVAENTFVTAAHCVLYQRRSRSQVYKGDWHHEPSLRPGKNIVFSFAKHITNTIKIETAQIISVSLPPLLNRCLSIMPRNYRCNDRIPLPDVAVITIAADHSKRFTRAESLTFRDTMVRSGDEITMMGYGMTSRNDESAPKLKWKTQTVAYMEEALDALGDSFASEEHDGLPNFHHTFPSLGPLATRGYANLGNGDSGGPVLDTATGEILGINSDAYCPIGDRGCQRTNNSIFSRVHATSGYEVGIWLKKILR
jgi:hypothetical protein